MIITTLGTGGMYSLKSFHSNYLVSAPGHRGFMLVDCGSDIRMSLAALGLGFDDIDAVYVTHCHADHAGGLQYLAFASMFRPAEAPKIKLYCHGDIAAEIWQTLMPACRLCLGMPRTLASYFDVITIRTGEEALWKDITLTPVAWAHVKGYDRGGLAADAILYPISMPSYGVTLQHNGVKVHVTGDVCRDEVPNVVRYLGEDDVALAFVDCDTDPVTYQFPVHPKFEDWAGTPPDIRCRLRLTHYGDNAMVKSESGHPEISPRFALGAKIAGLLYANIHEAYDTDAVGKAYRAMQAAGESNERSARPEPGTGTGECTCGRCRSRSSDNGAEAAQAAFGQGQGQGQGRGQGEG